MSHAEGGSVTLEPRVAKLGEKVRYSGFVLVGPGTVQWMPPANGDDLTWGKLRARRSAPHQSQRFGNQASKPSMVPFGDTLFVETEVAAFRVGEVRLPGLRLRTSPDARPTAGLPDMRLVVMPVLSAADSNAELRPARGPLAAPWWERIPWLKVLAVAVILAALVLLVVLLLRRRKKVPVKIAPPRPVQDPATRALAELAQLRQQHLPELGRFDEHALALTRVARRYLEAIDSHPRPGHTTRELLAALETSRVDSTQRRELERWLTIWDGIKFARVGTSVAEAEGAEQAVETLIRSTRPASAAPARQVA